MRELAWITDREAEPEFERRIVRPSGVIAIPFGLLPTATGARNLPATESKVLMKRPWHMNRCDPALSASTALKRASPSALAMGQPVLQAAWLILSANSP